MSRHGCRAAAQPVADGTEVKTQQLHPTACVFKGVTIARQAAEGLGQRGHPYHRLVSADH